jgi:hypothetical protein
MRRYEDYLYIGHRAFELSGGIQAVKRRHSNIEYNDIGSHFCRHRQRRSTITHVRYHFAHGREQLRKRLPQQTVIIRQ